MKVHEGQVSVKELYEMSRDNNISVSSTSLGAEEGKSQTVIKGAVDWKGVKAEGAFSGDDEAKRRLKKATASAEGDVVSGLEKAVKLSKATSEIYGTCLVEYPNGQQKVITRKNWAQMKAAGKHKKGYTKVDNLSMTRADKTTDINTVSDAQTKGQNVKQQMTGQEQTA